ncbi:Gfo/Idh/MocA family protein [Mobilicoccus pelagius]|uniref:Myo-inositol 2-dehydrogenase n=1 Tax=Mobilicoccus pelagius NBRC 104925 TaxID=1089455 RepID=H5USW6_9MICO|nr:Gfo/Idh/MocA family oxidoreductase [Mobilicoccus pelagius]GAB48824.1 myo-inositol 2-dehydrogenase [Mobilicoccus pelagius NBRC 104925]
MRIGIAGTGRIGAYHANTLRNLDVVDEVVLADAFPETAQRVAGELGLQAVESVDALLDSGLDGLVVASPTTTHESLIRAGVAAGIPTFCEKPVAASLDSALALAEVERASTVPIHIGFQRRFDAGYMRAHEAVANGELGFVHTVRAMTLDTAPPPKEYVEVSGGIFRDCSIHDFDIIRFVTGREVSSVCAFGANKGAPYIKTAGDVDTGSGVFMLDDDTIVSFSCSRHNAFGHDVRMEVHGSTGDIAVGLDDTLALTSAEPDATFPAGPRVMSFMDRFLPAYVRELTAFVEVVQGTRPSPCTVHDGVQAQRMAEACDLSRREGRVVQMSEIPDVADDVQAEASGSAV